MLEHALRCLTAGEEKAPASDRGEGVGVKRMAKNETSDLHLVVASDGIVVTMPGTDFLVIYTKPENTPWLMVTKLEDDRTASIKQAEFLARAWVAANAKARELSWIV